MTREHLLDGLLHYNGPLGRLTTKWSTSSGQAHLAKKSIRRGFAPCEVSRLLCCRWKGHGIAWPGIEVCSVGEGFGPGTAMNIESQRICFVRYMGYILRVCMLSYVLDID